MRAEDAGSPGSAIPSQILRLGPLPHMPVVPTLSSLLRVRFRSAGSRGLRLSKSFQLSLFCAFTRGVGGRAFATILMKSMRHARPRTKASVFSSSAHHQPNTPRRRKCLAGRTLAWRLLPPGAPTPTSTSGYRESGWNLRTKKESWDVPRNGQAWPHRWRSSRTARASFLSLKATRPTTPA
jgi:hypothetical protein